MSKISCVAFHCGSRGFSAIVPSSVCLAPKCFLGYFVGPKYFLVGISWVQNIFSGVFRVLWVFRVSKVFSRGYFVGPKFFRVGISWVQNFSREYLMGPKFFLVGSKFFLVGNFVIFSSWPDEKKRERNIFRTAYSFLNRFQQLWIQFILENHFIY